MASLQRIPSEVGPETVSKRRILLGTSVVAGILGHALALLLKGEQQAVRRSLCPPGDRFRGR
jgi:hypothetical protein